MEKCVTCDREISLQAEVCPHCGEPNAGRQAAEEMVQRAKRQRERNAEEAALEPKRKLDAVYGWSSFFAAPFVLWLGMRGDHSLVFWVVCIVGIAATTFVLGMIAFLICAMTERDYYMGRCFSVILWVVIIFAIVHYA